MSASFGLIGGVLALTALDAVVSSKGATNNVSGLLGTAAAIVRRLSDPTIAAIPDRSKSSSSTGANAPLPAPSTGPAVPTRYGSTTTNPKTGTTGAIFT